AQMKRDRLVKPTVMELEQRSAPSSIAADQAASGSIGLDATRSSPLPGVGLTDPFSSFAPIGQDARRHPLTTGGVLRSAYAHGPASHSRSHRTAQGCHSNPLEETNTRPLTQPTPATSTSPAPRFLLSLSPSRPGPVLGFPIPHVPPPPPSRASAPEEHERQVR